MHLLCTFATTGFDAWKADFDAHWEDRDRAGLTMLQMWRDLDAPDRALVLFEVADRKRAAEWIATASALGTPVEARFLRTA